MILWKWEMLKERKQNILVNDQASFLLHYINVILYISDGFRMLTFWHSGLKLTLTREIKHELVKFMHIPRFYVS